MGRRHNRYTELGRKIASLAENQSDLADALELTQQSISGKLTGKIAVTLRDLEILRDKYDAPLLFFFTPEIVTIEQARVWAKIMEGPHAMQQTVAMAAQLPEPFQLQLLRNVQAMRATAAYYVDAAMLAPAI